MNIDNIKKYVINLPSRTDRIEKFDIEFKKLDWMYEISEGVIDKVSRIGIKRAHQNVIRKAKDLNLDYVMVCEDDLMFTCNNKEYLYNAFNNIPEDFDILLLGIYSTNGLTKYNEFWQQTDVFSALTCYIMNSKVYDKFLNFDDDRNHIDRAMVHDLKFKCYVLNEFVVKQHNGYSDNVKRITNYDPLLSRFKFNNI